MAGRFNAFSHKALESQIRGVLRDNNIGELTSDKNMIPRAEFWLVPSDYSVQKKVIKVMLPSYARSLYFTTEVRSHHQGNVNVSVGVQGPLQPGSGAPAL